MRVASSWSSAPGTGHSFFPKGSVLDKSKFPLNVFALILSGRVQLGHTTCNQHRCVPESLLSEAFEPFNFLQFSQISTPRVKTAVVFSLLVDEFHFFFQMAATICNRSVSKRSLTSSNSFSSKCPFTSLSLSLSLSLCRVCSKKFAHQSAALVCLQALGIHDTQGNPTIT